MQKARDFLADHNLATRGGRGRFSVEAVEFLHEKYAEGVRFADWKPPTKQAKPQTKTVVPKDRRVLSVIDEYGFTVNLDTCHSCARAYSRCKCPEVSPPAYLKAQEWQIITL